MSTAGMQRGLPVAGSPSCSAGCLGPGVRMPPQACLDRCLVRDPQAIEHRGCALLRDLARGRPLPATAVPATCPQGLAVHLTPGRDEAEPAVMVLLDTSEKILKPYTEGLLAGMVALAREKARLHQENESLAGEVLHCYEQVNLIFDISGEVATLTDPQDVRRILLVKLRQIYAAEQALYLSLKRDCLLIVGREDRVIEGRCDRVIGRQAEMPPASGEPAGAVPPPETGLMLAQLARQPRVAVHAGGDEQILKEGHGTSLWGPLREGEDGGSVVGLVRRGKPFDAGDMLLLESTLTFAGHILSNMCLAERLQQSSLEAVRALVNTIDQKDNYTRGHSERVGFLSRAMGRRMGLSHRQLQELEWGGLLHDVGKIGIPEHILRKPGKLSDEEFAVIKQHPARGYTVLKPVASLQGVLDIVLHHHETPDGKGYPTGLKKEEIPLPARIVHVADTFDALTSNRPYRDAFNYSRAIEIMTRDCGPKIDADIFQVFLETWQHLPREYPQEWREWFAQLMEERR